MKLRGGYNIPLAGRPQGTVQVLDEAPELLLGLRTRRLTFSEVLVTHGQRVTQGQPLARAPEQYNVPLLAPRAGTVALAEDGLSLRLTDLAQEAEKPADDSPPPEHAVRTLGESAGIRDKLLDLGAWQFFSDAFTGHVPNPFGMPQAVIVSTVALEPFSARGDVSLKTRLQSFKRGLEHLQNLLEYQPIHLAVPDVQSELANEVRESVRGYARVKVSTIPFQYPYDHFAVFARGLGLSRSGAAYGQEASATWGDQKAVTSEDGASQEPDNYHPVWALRVEGVLAVDRALTQSKPATVRIVAVGGPGVQRPTHVKAMAGYPIQAILDACGAKETVRVLAGGALTGEIVPDHAAGLDAECTALTVLEDDERRQFLGFARLGADRQSYGRGFLSRLRPAFKERLTTALRGERRACVACGLCEDVCPVDLWPHLIHKFLYKNDLEQAQAAGIDLCVDCGLCSYVCPSKIELADQFRLARQALIEEQQAMEAERKKEEERLRKEAAAQAAAEQAAENDPDPPPDEGNDPPDDAGSQEVAE